MKAASTLPSPVRADLTTAFSPEAVGGGGGGFCTDGILGKFQTKQIAKNNYSQRTGWPGAAADSYLSGRPGCPVL